MKTLSVDIKDVLVAETDLVFGTDLFISSLPAEPLNVVSIYDTSAAPPTNTLDKSVQWNDSIQILVRNADYEKAFEIAFEIMDVLHLTSNQEINGTMYYFILAASSPFHLQNPEAKQNKRGETLLSLNFNVKRQKRN